MEGQALCPELFRFECFIVCNSEADLITLVSFLKDKVVEPVERGGKAPCVSWEGLAGCRVDSCDKTVRTKPFYFQTYISLILREPGNYKRITLYINPELYEKMGFKGKRIALKPEPWKHAIDELGDKQSTEPLAPLVFGRFRASPLKNFMFKVDDQGIHIIPKDVIKKLGEEVRKARRREKLAPPDSSP